MPEDAVPTHVINLYKFVYSEANKNPYSYLTRLFLKELFFSDKEAFESVNTEIACFVIGG